MALYRAMAGDGVAWITGASSGIGRELALQMARRGYTVAATARRAERLRALADEAASFGGTIHAFDCDVTDRDAMAETVRAIESRTGPVRLAVFNAGVYVPTRGEALDPDDFEKTFSVNLSGTMNGLVPAVERMKAHGRGQAVIVASVTGYTGLPAAAAYGATKAALINLAESLSFDFAKLNIRMQVANPGFVDTPATEQNDFEMPALMEVEKAAARMIDGIESGGFEITFPRRFTYLLKLLRMLPYPAYFAIMNRATGWRTRPLDLGDASEASAGKAG